MWKSSVFEYCVVTFQFTFLFIYISKHIASFSRLSLSRLLESRCFSSKIFAFHTFHDLSADCYFFFWVRLVEFFLFFIVVIISTNAKINTHRCVTDRSWLITLFCCAASLIFLRFLSTLCRECARDVVIDFRVVAYFCMIELLTICIDTHHTHSLVTYDVPLREQALRSHIVVVAVDDILGRTLYAYSLCS